MTNLINHSSHAAHLGLAGVLTGAAAALLEPLYFWVVLLVLCAFLIQLCLYRRWQKQPPERRTINLLAILSLIVLAYNGIASGLLQAMLNLLVLGSALKVLTLQRDSHIYQLALACLFILATVLVFHQTLVIALYVAMLFSGVWLSIMITVNPGQSLPQQAQRLGRLFLQAFPVTLLLFVAAPQFAPLWQMPTAASGRSGLDDTLTPGDIAHLAQSDQLAFRAEFDASIPATNQRYWRALTLEYFTGHSWQRAEQRLEQARRQPNPYRPQAESPIQGYQIIAEPHQHRWLYNLAPSLSTTGGVSHTMDYQLRRPDPGQGPFRYRALWLDQPRLSFEPELERRLNRQLPQSGNPRLRQWAQQLRHNHPEDVAYIQAIIEHIQQQPFRYTLKPEPMPTNTLDRFWFDHQAGFCAHYASAVAYLIRLGGIPARVVSGYLGGEVDDDGYLSVHQFDAHAWVEWMAGEQWRRLDPTVIAAPLRLSAGLEQAVAKEQSFLSDAPMSLYQLRSIAFFNQLRLWLNDLDYQWDHWVLGFDQQRQRDMLRAILGQLTPSRLILFGLGILLLITILLLLYQWPGYQRRRLSPVPYYYDKALKRLSLEGYSRPLSAGPVAFQQQIQSHLKPQASRAFALLTRLYCRYQYQDKAGHTRWARGLYRRFYRALK